MSTLAFIINQKFCPVADTDFNITAFGYQDADPHHNIKDVKPEPVLQYLTGGRGFLELDGKTFEVRAGDLFYLPKDKFVHYYACPQDPYTYYWAHLDGVSVPSLIRRAGFSEKEPVKSYNDGRIERVFAEILPLLREDTFTGYLSAKGHAFRLLSLLLSYRGENSEKMQSAKVKYVNTAMQFVKNNFGEDIGVTDMAAAAGVGRSYLCVLFKKITDVSPVRYLIEYRINQAKKMLASGLGVTETAVNCGFNSPAHFSVQFKNLTGVSPSAFRR